MKIITIVSGKGGVGKSTVGAVLIHLLSSKLGKDKIIGIDCDVDAADLHLLLGKNSKVIEEYEDESSEKAFIDYDKCISCGKCDVCRFNALKLNDKKQPVIDKYACEGCGACAVVCPVNAINIKPVKNAVIRVLETKYSLLITGQLKMGESGSGNVVTALKNKAKSVIKKKSLSPNYIIQDSAAGISCPVIASINGSDYVVAVTEPTPSGLFDLKRVLKIVNHFKIPFGIIINKFDINPEMTEKIEQIYPDNILTKIPFDKKIVESIVNMHPLTEIYPEFTIYFSPVIDIISDTKTRNNK